MPKIDEAFSLYMKMILGVGADLRDADAGVLPRADGRRHRGGMLLKYFKYAVPRDLHHRRRHQPGTDMASQLVMAVPMIGLYLLSIGIAFIFQKRRKPLTHD